MHNDKLYAGIGLGLAAAAGVAALVRPGRNRRMRRAVKTVGKALGAVPGIMGW